MAAGRLSGPGRLWRGEGAPGGATGRLARNARRGQLPDQPEGRLRRDRQAISQAAGGDDQGADHVVDGARHLRACGAGEPGAGEFGAHQAGQFFAAGTCRGGDAGQKPGNPGRADLQREAMEELGGSGPEGEGMSRPSQPRTRDTRRGRSRPWSTDHHDPGG